MTEQPSLLRADITSYVGLQVVLLGILMFSIGVWFGTNWLGEAAWASIVTSAPPGVTVDVPAYLRTASAINLWAVVTSCLSLLGLIGLDWVGRDA